jgi:CDGSH-type Zn-finger protein
MVAPTVAQKSPIAADLEAGKTYYWCTCGKSASEPFCSGAHQGTAFTPLPFTAPETKTAYLCACKQTKGRPYCDGAHKSL